MEGEAAEGEAEAGEAEKAELASGAVAEAAACVATAKAAALAAPKRLRRDSDRAPSLAPWSDSHDDLRQAAAVIIRESESDSERLNDDELDAALSVQPAGEGA